MNVNYIFLYRKIVKDILIINDGTMIHLVLNHSGLTKNLSDDSITLCSELVYVLHTNGSRTSFLIAGIALAVGCIPATMFNLCFLVVMKRNRKLHRLSNYLLVTLSVLDLITGSVIMPLSAIILIERSRHVLHCKLQAYTSVIGYSVGTMSLITILTITVEQFLAVMYPYYHQSHVTIKKLLPVNILFWVLLSIFCIAAWFYTVLWVIYQSFLGLLIVNTFVVVIYCYARMFRVAKRTRKMITSINKSLRRKTKTNNKNLKTSAAIIVAFVISYIPIGLLVLWRLIFGTTHFERTYLYEWAQVFASYNTVINPLVYYWRLRGVKKELRKIFVCKCCENYTLSNVYSFNSYSVSTITRDSTCQRESYKDV